MASRTARKIELAQIRETLSFLTIDEAFDLCERQAAANWSNISGWKGTREEYIKIAGGNLARKLRKFIVNA
jgi:hypothetical protein